MKIGERLGNLAFRHPVLRRTITRAAMASTRLPLIGDRLRRAYYNENLVPRETLPHFLSAALSFSGGTTGLEEFIVDHDPEGRPIYGMEGFRSKWCPKGIYIPSYVSAGDLRNFLTYLDGNVPFHHRPTWLAQQNPNTQIAIQQMLDAERG